VCIRLGAIFANAGAGEDDKGDVEGLGCIEGGGEGMDGWMDAVRSTCSAWGLTAVLSRGGGGDEVKGLVDGQTEAARSTRSAWGLITVLSRGESTREKGGSFLSLVSSDPGGPRGILLPASCKAREGSTFRDGVELVTGRSCVVRCIELINKMGPGLVIPSRCAARASFEVEVSEEDMGCIEALCVLFASERGCNGGQPVRNTSGSYYTNVGAHRASSRSCVELNVKLTCISALRYGSEIP
jgi:hypothetical protein